MRTLGNLVVWVILLLWLLLQLQPRSDTLMAPVRMVQGIQTSIELNNIGSIIAAEYYLNSERLLPEAEFQRFMDRHFSRRTGASSAVDTWGNPYSYRTRSRDFEVRSFGPDGKPGTQDDIVYLWRKR